MLSLPDKEVPPKKDPVVAAAASKSATKLAAELEPGEIPPPAAAKDGVAPKGLIGLFDSFPLMPLL